VSGWVIALTGWAGVFCCALALALLAGRIVAPGKDGDG
jgi:hypothetical protein